LGVSGPGLVDDLAGHADLADIVEQRSELGVAPVACVQVKAVADVKHERDDVAAVAAGVRVVGLDDVAEQHRRAAIGMAELERVVDAGAPLAGELAQETDQRQNE